MRIKHLLTRAGTVLFTVLLTAKIVPAGELSERLVIVENGAPAAVLVLAEKPTRAAQLAAYELQYHLKLITGVEVPIQSEADNARVPIYIGESESTVARGWRSADFDRQEYLLKIAPSATDPYVLLIGRDAEDHGQVSYDENDWKRFGTWPLLWDDQGTLYAVYDFLERCCEVRWFNPTELGTDYIRREKVSVPALELRRKPAFEYRDIGHPMNISESYEAYTWLWDPEATSFIEAERMAYSKLHERWPQRWNYIHAKRGQVRLFLHRMRLGGTRYRANHSFYGYYDRFYEKNDRNDGLFEAEHKDWFAQGYENKPPQMCYSNKAFIQQVIDDARAYFDGEGLKKGAMAHGDFFALVPMDNGAWCKCEQCQELIAHGDAQRDFFSNGMASDYVFQFCNQVAKELRKTHPDKYLATLAYADYARYPRKIRLEDNLSVQLCLHVRNCYDQLFQENDWAIYDSWLTKEKNRPIYLWLYYTFPKERGQRTGWHVFPGFFSQQIDRAFKRYHADGIRGMFLNGFAQGFDAWLTLKMMDDPEPALTARATEYFQRYYGAAATPMQQFYAQIEAVYSSPENYPMRYRDGQLVTVGHQTEEMAWRYLGTPQRLAELQALIDQAQNDCQTELERQRVDLLVQTVWNYIKAGPHRVEIMERHEQWAALPAVAERFLYRLPTTIRTDDAATGRPFVLETPGSYFTGAEGTIPASKGVIHSLTDGTCSETIFYHGGAAEKYSLICELDAADGGQELRVLSVYWSLADSQRSRAKFKFQARHAATGRWEDVSRWYTFSTWEAAKVNSYRSLTLEFPAGALTGIDAVRLIDASAEEGFNTTRFCEIDVVVSNN